MYIKKPKYINLEYSDSDYNADVTDSSNPRTSHNMRPANTPHSNPPSQENSFQANSISSSSTLGADTSAYGDMHDSYTTDSKRSNYLVFRPLDSLRRNSTSTDSTMTRKLSISTNNTITRRLSNSNISVNTNNTYITNNSINTDTSITNNSNKDYRYKKPMPSSFVPKSGFSYIPENKSPTNNNGGSDIHSYNNGIHSNDNHNDNEHNNFNNNLNNNDNGSLIGHNNNNYGYKSSNGDIYAIDPKTGYPDPTEMLQSNPKPANIDDNVAPADVSSATYATMVSDVVVAKDSTHDADVKEPASNRRDLLDSHKSKKWSQEYHGRISSRKPRDHDIKRTKSRDSRHEKDSKLHEISRTKSRESRDYKNGSDSKYEVRRTKSRESRQHRLDEFRLSEVRRVKSRESRDYKFQDIKRVKSREGRDFKSDDLKRVKSRDIATEPLTRRYTESHINNGNSFSLDHHRSSKTSKSKEHKDEAIDPLDNRFPQHKSPYKLAQRRAPRTSRLINNHPDVSISHSRRSSRSSLQADVLKKLKKSPTVAYPEGVEYRPGRIQSITGEQEVILKQIWANLLKSWGYPLNMTVEDIKHLESFVASSNTSKRDNYIHPLKRIQTKRSILSFSSTKTFKRRRQFWKFKHSGASADEQWALNSDRLRDVQIKSYIERYEPAIFPSKDIINVFVNHYNLSYEFADDYISSGDEYDFDESKEDDAPDNSSMETFVTANSNFAEIAELNVKKTDINTNNFGVVRRLPRDKPKNPTGAAVFHTLYHSGAVPKSPIECYDEMFIGMTPILPKDFQYSMMAAIRNDLVDNLILRYARARNWNTMASLQMIRESLSWRTKFFPDKWLMEGDAPSYLNGTNKGFVRNFTTEKGWMRGHDYEKNPIFWFLARKHFGSDSSAFDVQRYIVLLIEWSRLRGQEVTTSKDTFTIVFDLTGFTLKNADYTAIKFLAEVFEAHYPETLSKILVHNAPWIFSTVWNIIKHWIHPIIAEKIFFTKNYYDLLEFIDAEYIPKHLGGNDIEQSEYPIPKAGDDRPPKKKDINYRRLKKSRDDLMMRFIDCSRKWVEATNPDVSALYLEEKIALNIELSNNYLELDPYLRNHGLFDRNHSLHVLN